MTKIRKTVLLTESMNQKLEEVADQEGVSQSDFVAKAINYYINNDGMELPNLVDAINLIVQNNFEEFNEELKRVRFAVNDIAKATNMNREFWNHYFFVNEFDELASINRIHTNPIKQAELVVDTNLKRATGKRPKNKKKVGKNQIRIGGHKR